MALKRSLDVWFRGLGLGIPIVTIITTLVAYFSLREDGETSWDRYSNCAVSHSKLSVFRWFIIAIAWLVPLFMWLLLIAEAA